MELIIKNYIDNNIFTFRIEVEPNTKEKEMFSILGEPYINIAATGEPTKLMKLFTDSPFKITNIDQTLLIEHKNSLVNLIMTEMSDLKDRLDNIIIEDEIIKF